MNLALSGKIASGKTTLAEGLMERFGYHIISIGTTIKKTCSLLIENEEEFSHYLSQMIENKTIYSELNDLIGKTFQRDFKSLPYQKMENGLYVKNQSYRDLTQFVATSLRHQLGEDVWVQFLTKETEILSREGKKVVCDDLRVLMEKKVFEAAHFKIIRLDVSKEVQQERIQKRGDGFISEEQLIHPTEISLDNETFDLRLDTDNMTIEDVRQMVYDYIANNV